MLEVHNRRSRKEIKEFEELKNIAKFFYPPPKEKNDLISYGMRLKAFINQIYRLGFEGAKYAIYYNVNSYMGATPMSQETFLMLQTVIKFYQDGLLSQKDKADLFRVFNSLEKEYKENVPQIKKRKLTRLEIQPYE